jgi:hypothetical protein
MSRYFFNFRQGDNYSSDEEGCDFDSMEQAYLAAFGAAQDMWRDLLVARKDPLACAFEITDANGRELLLLPFGEVLDACRDRSAISPHNFKKNGAFQEALEGRRLTQNLMSEISTALNDARAALRETASLLARANKLEAD